MSQISIQWMEKSIQRCNTNFPDDGQPINITKIATWTLAQLEFVMIALSSLAETTFNGSISLFHLTTGYKKEKLEKYKDATTNCLFTILWASVNCTLMAFTFDLADNLEDAKAFAAKARKEGINGLYGTW